MNYNQTIKYKVIYILGSFEIEGAKSTISVPKEKVTSIILPNMSAIIKNSPNTTIANLTKAQINKLYELRDTFLETDKKDPVKKANKNYAQQKDLFD